MFFRGERKGRRVDLGGSRSATARQRRDLLQEAREKRNQRHQERLRLDACALIIASIRSHICRIRTKQSIRNELRLFIAKLSLQQNAGKISAQDIALLLRRLLFIFNVDTDILLLKSVLSLMVASLQSREQQFNYAQVFTTDPDRWCFQMRKIFSIVLSERYRQHLAPARAIAYTAVFFLSTPDKWGIKATAEHRLASQQILSEMGTKEESFRVLRKEVLSQMPLPLDISDAASVASAREHANLTEITLACTMTIRLLTAPSSPESTVLRRRLFVQHIMTIPLLRDRLTVYRLAAIVPSLQQPEIWSGVTETICIEPALLKQMLPEKSSSFSVSGAQDVEYSLLGWLLGNVLDLGRLSENGSILNRQIEALCELVSCSSSDVFPPRAVDIADKAADDDSEDESSSESIGSCTTWEDLHPQLIRQLELFLDRGFLQALSQRLVQGSATQINQVEMLSQMLGKLIEMWPSARSMILNIVVFGSNLVSQLWSSLSVFATKLDSYEGFVGVSSTLSFFCLSYGHLLRVMNDQEFFAETPFSMQEVARIVRFLKDILICLYWTEGRNVTLESSRLRQSACETFGLLRDRHSRRSFAEETDWHMDEKQLNFFTTELNADAVSSVRVASESPDRMHVESVNDFEGDQAMALASSMEEDMTSAAGRCGTIFREVPFLIPFSHRVSVFYQVIAQHSASLAASSNMFERGLGIRARIRRDHVVEDGFSALAGLGSGLKGRIQIEFIDEHGLQERGIDGGGLFKEFLNALCKQAFDPRFGLFLETDDHNMYPNPVSFAVHDQHLDYMNFFGMIMGKALFEGITIEPKFSHFFLRKLLGAPHSIDDLKSMDPEVYRNLLLLKEYTGDFSQLGLYFCVVNDELGQKEVVELVPGGSERPVTAANRLEFIHRLADYKLNRRTKSQSIAFLRGIGKIVRRRWLRLFSADELQMLISGSEHDIDVEDWRKHTHYNGFRANSPVIEWFWQIVSEMSPAEKADLLRFATSCSRPPLQGFVALTPKFGIQMALDDPTALPSASTCVNLMRFPAYPSLEVLRQKIMYAISSGAGFGLS